MKVIVIGNCTVDLSFSVGRFPRSGETILADEKSVDLGGKGANQAVVAARFGAATLLAAPIGRDAEGEWACRKLEAEGFDPEAMLRVDVPTDQSIIFVEPGGENCIVSSHQAAAAATAEWAAEILARYSAPGDILMMQGNLSLDTTGAALAAARRLSVTTIVNPAPIQFRYESLLPLIDIMVVNEIEATDLGGRSDPLQAAEAICAAGAPCTILTLGREGAVLIGDGALSRVPAPAVNAIDTVGAGDALCGALAGALARGFRVAPALRIGVEAASLSVTRKGTQASFPTKAEATEILARHSA